MKTILSLIALVALALPAGAQEHDHAKSATNAKAAVQEALPAQTTCPISGDVLEDKETFVDYEGQRVYVCCKKCVKKFTAFPDKYISAMAKSGQAVENTQTTCVVSGEELDQDAVTLAFGNKTIKVCCKKCAKKVNAEPVKYFDKLEGRKAQERCAVMGGKIIPKNSFVVNGTHVDQCCPGCEKKWRAEPAKYFSKLSEQKIVLQPASNRCPVMPKMAVKDRRYFVTMGARRFYFCSEGTRAKFLENPKKYMKNLDKMPETGPPPAAAKTVKGKAGPEATAHDGASNHGEQS
jgi:YHS domain-containing protein